jgi:hypothetical protein
MKNIHRVFVLLVVSVLGALAIAACSTAGAIVPATASTPTTASQAQAVASPTTQAAATPEATLTSAGTSAPAATRTSAPIGPITVATIATNDDAPGNPAKVYVSAIRVNPAQPVSGPNYITFNVTFVNNSGQSQALKWYVKIWSPSNTTQSFGETAKQINDIPVGTSVIASASNWRTNPLNCESFTARVYWLNSTVNYGNPVEFTKADGSAGVQQNFQVCEPTKTP